MSRNNLTNQQKNQKDMPMQRIREVTFAENLVSTDGWNTKTFTSPNPYSNSKSNSTNNNNTHKQKKQKQKQNNTNTTKIRVQITTLKIKAKSWHISFQVQWAATSTLKTQEPPSLKIVLDDQHKMDHQQKSPWITKTDTMWILQYMQRQLKLALLNYNKT